MKTRLDEERKSFLARKKTYFVRTVKLDVKRESYETESEPTVMCERDLRYEGAGARQSDCYRNEMCQKHVRRNE